MTIKCSIKGRDRNQPCPCGSGLVAKHCHADSKKLQRCNEIAQRCMILLIVEERKRQGLEPRAFVCEKCGKGTDRPRVSEFAKNVLLCPDEKCGSTVIEKNEKPKNKQEKKSIILEA